MEDVEDLEEEILGYLLEAEKAADKWQEYLSHIYGPLSRTPSQTRLAHALRELELAARKAERALFFAEL